MTFSIRRRASTRNVHRLVCEAFHGPAPEGKPLALHRDGVRTNNTPENLYWGDWRDNMLDRVRHGNHPTFQPDKTHCPAGHEYSEGNTYIIPSTGSRSCRKCKRRQGLESYHRRAQKQKSDKR